MNHIFGRKQAVREIDDRDIVFDARPPSPEAAVERLHRVIKNMPEPESEVMPPVSVGQRQPNGSDDTRPPSHSGADRINRLDDIATLIRTARYSEFIALAEGIGVDPKALWRWASR